MHEISTGVSRTVVIVAIVVILVIVGAGVFALTRYHVNLFNYDVHGLNFLLPNYFNICQLIAIYFSVIVFEFFYLGKY